LLVLATEIATAAAAALLDGVDAELVVGLAAELLDAGAGGGVVDPLFLLLEQAVTASAPAQPATSTSCLIIIVLLAEKHGGDDGSVQNGTSA
jgi:hypothetical protein